MRALILFCMLPVALFAANYFSASGQTASFTLTAGAKAGWNSTAAVEKSPSLVLPSTLKISSTGSGLFVQTGAKGVLKIYDVRGSLATSLSIDHDGFTALPRGLANGVYVARFESLNKIVKVARLAVVR